MVSALTSSSVWRHGAFCASRQHRRLSTLWTYFSVVISIGFGFLRSLVLGVAIKCFFAMNFECKSTFKSKWKRFLIITLKIWAQIEVTKHVFMADEFIPYRLSSASQCSLNAIKWVYVGFSASKQQSFFWKVSFNPCLMGRNQLYTGALAKVLGKSLSLKYYRSVHNMFHLA